MKKYLWLLILLPLGGFAPAHFVVFGADVGETMTWYRCRAEARNLNEEMTRHLTGAERVPFRVSCRFGFGDASNSDTGERYVWTPNDEKVIREIRSVAEELHYCKRRRCATWEDRFQFEECAKYDWIGERGSYPCDVVEKSYWDLLASTTDEQFDRFCTGNDEQARFLNELGAAVISGCARVKSVPGLYGMPLIESPMGYLFHSAVGSENHLMRYDRFYDGLECTGATYIPANPVWLASFGFVAKGITTQPITASDVFYVPRGATVVQPTFLSRRKFDDSCHDISPKTTWAFEVFPNDEAITGVPN